MTSGADLGGLVRGFYEQVWNAGRYEVAEEVFDPEFRTAAAPELRGAAAKVAVVRGYRATFPDLHVEIDDLVVGVGAGGVDTVAVRWTVTGTDTGGFRGRPATGRRVTAWGVEHFGFRDGRIVANWVGTDWLGVLVQLGVIPGPWRS